MSKYGRESKIYFGGHETRFQKSLMCFLSDIRQKILNNENYPEILSFIQIHEKDIGTRIHDISKFIIMQSIKTYLEDDIHSPQVISEKIENEIVNLFNEIRDIETNKEVKGSVERAIKYAYSRTW